MTARINGMALGLAKPHHRLLRGIVVGALAVSACSSGGSDADPTAVTLGSVPDLSDATSDPEADLPPATRATDPIDSSPASTIGASPDLDLPTELPTNDTGPVTTPPGPLATPSVRLLDVATFDRPTGAVGHPTQRRLFVVEQEGRIVAVDDESSDLVFDIADVAGVSIAAENERGLLGLAFHPQLDLAFIDYTDGDGNTVIAELAIDPITADFDPSTYREVLTVVQPFANHNGGGLVFGPDDLLYIGMGDGGFADDPNRSALDPAQRLGKILRIDPVESDDDPFSVPADNPFVGVEGADPTIWSLGLRNPWRFSFDALTGDLWIADVGQNRLEEINLASATNGLDAGRGVSFGWSAFEAEDRLNEDQGADGHTLPVVSYAHADGNCSVSGGVVVRGSAYNDFNGWYVYGDYCSGRVWALDSTSVTSTPDGPVGDPVIVDIATVPGLAAIVDDGSGDIFAISNAGPVYRLIPA